MEPARFVKSNRNKEILVDTNNYEYCFKDIQKDVVNPTSYWYCRQRDSQKCTAKAKTIVKDDQVFIKELSGNHNHSTQILIQKVRKIEAEAVENAARNPNLPAWTVLANLSNTLHSTSEAASSSMSTLKSIQMKIYRARIQGHPKLPKDSSDLLNMPAEFAKLDSCLVMLKKYD